ncbi:hypothetical protein [uncultured Roseobacter sp.]|uniref:hypothetical protein n=1 Tax=uncultured Roseobacter sp. TaxID=114847 RepID=UPI0026307FC4|nr:hypothetical protein [uncultured Roseobacter sp.]
MTDFKWIPTVQGPDGRPCEYQIEGHIGKVGVRRYTGNRPLRPYYLAGPAVPEEFGGYYRLLAVAKADAETVLRGLLDDNETSMEGVSHAFSEPKERGPGQEDDRDLCPHSEVS